MAEALTSLSNSVDSLQTLYTQMRAEMEIKNNMFEGKIDYLQKAVAENHNSIMCLQHKYAIVGMTKELDTLFASGYGRRTPEFQTIIDPTKTSTCDEGQCQVHVIQVFLDNVFNEYHSKPVP